MRETQEGGGKLRDYAKRSAYRSQYRGGGRRSAWTQHKTQHRPPQADSRTDGCAEPAARCPLAITEKHTALHYWLFYTSRKREGALHYCKDWGGVLTSPRLRNGTPGGRSRVGRGEVYTQGGTGDFNQALATRGRTEGLGSGHRVEMAPGKVKDRGLGNVGGSLEKPDLGLRISVLLVPALAPCLPNPGLRMAYLALPSCWGRGAH